MVDIWPIVKYKKWSGEIFALMRLPGLCDGICWAGNSQSQVLLEQSQNLDAVLAEGHRPAVAELTGRIV